MWNAGNGSNPIIVRRHDLSVVRESDCPRDLVSKKTSIGLEMRLMPPIKLLVILLMVAMPRSFGSEPLVTNEASYVKFRWACAKRAAYPRKTLDKIVRSTMKEEGFDGFGAWGDRAVAFDLNGDRKPEYFVPLDCGGSGNCVWGLFASGPVRRLAIINGRDIYVSKSRGRWSDIVVYSHFSAVEGSLTTYRISNGHYLDVSPRVTVDLDDSPSDKPGDSSSQLPKALEVAKRICAAAI